MGKILDYAFKNKEILLAGGIAALWTSIPKKTHDEHTRIGDHNHRKYHGWRKYAFVGLAALAPAIADYATGDTNWHRSLSKMAANYSVSMEEPNYEAKREFVYNKLTSGTCDIAIRDSVRLSAAYDVLDFFVQDGLLLPKQHIPKNLPEMPAIIPGAGAINSSKQFFEDKNIDIGGLILGLYISGRIGGGIERILDKESLIATALAASADLIYSPLPSISLLTWFETVDKAKKFGEEYNNLNRAV